MLDLVRHRIRATTIINRLSPKVTLEGHVVAKEAGHERPGEIIGQLPFLQDYEIGAGHD